VEDCYKEILEGGFFEFEKPISIRHLYSNSGYFMLSVIVHRASGKTLREFADEFIFKPLGMLNVK
jgi:CubicO group peptidase (beta-lactamase class C family)